VLPNGGKGKHVPNGADREGNPDRPPLSIVAGEIGALTWIN